MSPEVMSRLEQFFAQRTDGELRSIVTYDHDRVDIVYVRDDARAAVALDAEAMDEAHGMVSAARDAVLGERD